MAAQAGDPASVVAEDRARQRRTDLGHFLRSRREQLSPRAIGREPGSRRRTPGLRREEVSVLSDVSVEWIARLEQGRPITVSNAVLDRLARALRLEPFERRYLFRLAGRPEADASDGARTVPTPLLRALDGLAGVPAYVIGRSWDILAWNRAATALFGDLSALDPGRRNCLWLALFDPVQRRRVVDWEDHARRHVAAFRAELAADADLRLRRWIEPLEAESPLFREMWDRHAVCSYARGAKAFVIEPVGTLRFEHVALAVEEGAGLRLVLYTPDPGDGTPERLATLMRPRRPRREDGAFPRDAIR